MTDYKWLLNYYMTSKSIPQYLFQCAAFLSGRLRTVHVGFSVFLNECMLCFHSWSTYFFSFDMCSMEEKKKRALRVCHVDLINKMNPEDMKHPLYERKLLTPDEFERLNLPHQTTRDKNTFILLQIPKKGRDAFDLFVDCLQETAGDNPPHQELYTTLIQNLENITISS